MESLNSASYGPRSRAWQTLQARADALERRSIAELFAEDARRGEYFCRESDGLMLDLSRQRIDRRGLEELLELAVETGVSQWIERLFAGAPVNNTEDRAALHVALRRPADAPLWVDGEDVMHGVEAERRKMRALTEALHRGELHGYTGKPITDVVNIGIGGSDLGIVMALEALAEYRRLGIGMHCVSNIDGVDLTHTLARVAPDRTLFVICSKSFTTLETLVNARAVREWLLGHGGPTAVAAQCVAVSTNHPAMDEFGIAPDRRFAMWDWVGGRYSVWSAVGLAVALGIGWANFEAFLAGGHAMDRHFERAELRDNLPVLLALIGIWNRNFLGATSHAVLPYDAHLHRFPAFLQQLEMESNGKRVRRNGEPVDCPTCPIVWGEPGSNAQHSFFQLLHQGTERYSADFLLPARSGVGRQEQQDLAAANCLAQSWALAVGDPESGSAGRGPHQRYPGNRGNTLIAFERLDPATLGKLVALYEHKVFVQGVIWDINSFDQWGVELGKRLASRLAGAIGGPGQDPTEIAPVLAAIRRWRS